MSLVHYTKDKLPNEKEMVYADNGKLKDRCVFIKGKFVGGGEQPVPEYELENVFRWFSLKDYITYHKNETCFSVNFDIAGKIISPPPSPK